MLSEDIEHEESQREWPSLGDPHLVHRHRCEVGGEIYECQPCWHFQSAFISGRIPRVCQKHWATFRKQLKPEQRQWIEKLLPQDWKQFA